MKQKAFFIIFTGLSLKQIKRNFFGRWESDFKVAGLQGAVWLPSCFCEDSNFKSEFRVQFEFNSEFKTELKYISNSISIKNQFKTHFIPVFLFQVYFPKFTFHFKNLKRFLHSTLPTIIHGPLRPITLSVQSPALLHWDFVHFERELQCLRS